MGYGSNAAKLPIVFNGTVIDAPVSDGYVTLTAVSDGHQLEKPTTTKLVGAGSSYAFQDGGILGTGSDPSLIIKHSLIAATWWDNLTGGNFRDHSSGVSNFGEVIFEGALRYSAEVEFNIYSSRRTKIESGIGELSRFNLVNGIVNWENEYNLFSVSVQEPTPWKIMEVCRRACPDFVAAAEPFALRSTAFFGKWWWPYHFTYSSSILKLVANPLVNTVYSLKENELMRSPDGTKALQVAEESKSIYWHNVSFAKESDKLLILAEITRILREQNDSIDNVYKIEAVARAFHVYSKTLKRYVIMQTGINPDNTPVWSLLNTESIPEDRFTAGTKEAEAILSDTVIPKETKYGRVMDYDTWRATIDKLKDVSTLQMHLRWKPYMQAYIAHSGINLLDNNIRADGTRVVTDAIGMHQYNGYISPTSVSKTIAYSVDTDIHPTDRKTMMVDTGIMLTGLQAGTDALAGGLTSIGSKIPFLGTVFSEANKYIEESPTTPAIENAVVSALIDQVKEMYQGWFTIQGMASVKPRDLFLLTDHITDLRGPVTVKDVVHRMDAQTGFITMISPDAVVLPHDSIIGKQMLVSLTTGPLHRLGAFLIVKGAAAGLMQAAKNKWLYSSYDGTLSKNFRKYKKIQKQLDLSEELNDLKAKSIKLLDEQHASLRFRLRTASNNRVLDSLDDYIQLDPSLEELVNKLKEIDKQKALLLKSTPTDSPTTIVTMAKNLGVLEKDSDIARRITIGANLKEKMLVFEAQLEKQIAEMAKIKGTPGQKVPGIDYGWTDSEIDEAISRWADQARAEFIAENAEDVKDVIGQLARDSDLAKELEELRIINNRLGEYGRSKVMNTRSWNVLQEPIKADMARKEELIKKINQRIKNFEVIEEDLDSLDTALRRLFTFEPVVFADGKRVSAFKAAWEGVTSTPGAIVKGTGALAKGIWDEIFTGYAERKAALELLDNPKLGWAMPTPAVKLMGSLKKLDDEINNDAEAALKKAIEEAKAAGKELNVKEKAKILEEAKDVARKLKKDLMILKLKEAAQNTITGIRLLKYMGPQAILSLAVDAAIFLLGSSLVEGHNARLRARQCVKIIPLRAGEIPYVAGIKGHQGAVIGDNPSWVDELISGLHGVQNGVLPQAGTTLLMFIASMNGVELPEWGRTAADTAYLESLKKNGSDIKVQ
jgi:AraC-like DNA-binding protein